VDTSVPVITLPGSNPQTIEVGTVYTELGATVADANDAGLVATIDSSAVNTGLAGTYSVTYDAVDPAGNHAVQVTRTVNVVDTSVPVITLTGANPQTIEVGTSYTELGATVADANDAGLVVTIDSSEVNTGLVGAYSVTYDAVDPAGNHAVQVTRTVNVVDTSVPVITLTGSNPQTIEVGTSYTELGATVADTNDAGLVATIDSSAVNTGLAGTYSVTYDAVDPAGNHAIQITRTVIVTAASTYSVSGYVFDNLGVVLRSVFVKNGSNSVTTAADGSYSISGLTNGTYNLSYTRADYGRGYLEVVISGADLTNKNETLNRLPSERYINGTVIDSGESHLPLAGVTISTTGAWAVTDGSGKYSLAVASGSYPLTASYDIRYYTNSSVTVSTEFDAVVNQDIELQLKPTGTITGTVRVV
jgi:hypothetical protein